MAEQIIMYGTSWCGDCARAKRMFDKKAVKYTFTDIEKDKQGAEFVEKTNKGSRSVPTILFPDGSVLVEPSDGELEKKLSAAGYK